MKPPVAAVIFDMDGVIVDSEPLHERAFRHVFGRIGHGETHGIHFPSYYGTSDVRLWRDFIARHNPPEPFEDLLRWKEEHFNTLLAAEEPVFPGLEALLERCSATWPVAVASGSRHATIRSVLGLRNLRRFFSAVASSEDVPNGKPAPDVFLHAAGQLGVAPGACVVIEDSAAGVQGALAAGMTAIGITNSLPAEKLAHAHHVVRGYGEIETLLFGGRPAGMTNPE